MSKLWKDGGFLMVVCLFFESSGLEADVDSLAASLIPQGRKEGLVLSCLVFLYRPYITSGRAPSSLGSWALCCLCKAVPSWLLLDCRVEGMSLPEACMQPWPLHRAKIFLIDVSVLTLPGPWPRCLAGEGRLSPCWGDLSVLGTSPLNTH